MSTRLAQAATAYNGSQDGFVCGQVDWTVTRIRLALHFVVRQEALCKQGSTVLAGCHMCRRGLCRSCRSIAATTCRRHHGWTRALRAGSCAPIGTASLELACSQGTWLCSRHRLGTTGFVRGTGVLPSLVCWATVWRRACCSESALPCSAHSI